MFGAAEADKKHQEFHQQLQALKVLATAKQQEIDLAHQEVIKHWATVEELKKARKAFDEVKYVQGSK